MTKPGPAWGYIGSGDAADQAQAESLGHTHDHTPSTIPSGCACGWNHPGAPEPRTWQSEGGDQA